MELQLRLAPPTNQNRCFEDAFLGWPPLKKEFTRRNRLTPASNYVVTVDNNAGGGRRGVNSMYVKVKMEGVGIGRKVNVRVHNSYRSLRNYLIALFGKYEGDAEKYEVIYQDREGEWNPAGDVPWERFIESVQRMKLKKKINVM